MLRCIRCGACLNICPVYRHITGHAYGSIYPGPMGIVLTPLLVGYEKAEDLPWACTLCAGCSEHCPAKIPLHELILRHRQIEVENVGHGGALENLVYKAAGKALSSSAMFDMGTKVGAFGMPILGSEGQLRENVKMPVIRNWTSSRNMKYLEKRKFRDWVKQHEAEKKGGN